MRRFLLTLLVFVAPGAMASERPAGVNCALNEPPAQAGEEFNHGATLKIFPRAKDIPKTYVGCQIVWVTHLSKFEVLMVAVIERGYAVRVWSPDETESAQLACRYRQGKLVRGNRDRCPVPESLIMKSMAPGCVERISKHAATARTVFPEGCDYE